MQPKLPDILSDASLLAAWSKVRENEGGPGVDGETLKDFERRLMANLSTLRNEVLYGTYRPKPLLRVEVPKKQGGMRPLSIPAVRDRVLQTAVGRALTPLFEAEFEDISFAYRKGRSVDQAVARVEALRDQGYRWVVDADIYRFFDEVDQALLMAQVERLVHDEGILDLLRLWLKADVWDGKHRFRLEKGVPQGSPLSPLLSNLYLDHLDEALLEEKLKAVRFADDFLILCKNREKAQDALELTAEVLAALRLRFSEEKTRVVHFNHGFRFLGVQFIRSLAFKARYPPVDLDLPKGKGTARRERNREPPAPERPPDQTPTGTLADAFAEAGVEPEDFREAAQPIQPPDEAVSHRLDPRLRTLYLLQHGQVLGKESERLVIRANGRVKAEIPAIKVDQIMVFGNAQITTQAMRFCLRERIPIYLLSAGGRYYGVVDSFDTDPVLLQQAQFRKADDAAFCLKLARELVRGKIANSRTLLLRTARKHDVPAPERAALELKRVLAQLSGADSLDALRGFEGNAARVYFGAMQHALTPDWGFTGRNRQPPRDPVNAMLSYGYTLLFYNVYSFIRARGLNPHVGYLHPLRAGHPALASDMVEEFRAMVVDGVVWNLTLNRRLGPDDFIWPPEGGHGCLLREPARARFIREMEKKFNAPITHPVSGLKLDYRRCMEHQINLLAAIIRDTQPAYHAMVLR
jgi:CRISPR-associated protein Cas1